MALLKGEYMIRKLILAVVVAVAVTLGLLLLGSILVSASNDPTSLLVTIGKWLKSYGSLIGLLAGLWYYFADGWQKP